MAVLQCSITKSVELEVQLHNYAFIQPCIMIFTLSFTGVLWIMCIHPENVNMLCFLHNNL